MKIVFVFTLCLLVTNIKAQSPGNTGIGTSTPHPSAKLDITANNAGLLIPRLTTLQRNQIPDAAHGLMIFDTDLDLFFYKSLNGWMDMGSGSGSTQFGYFEKENLQALSFPVVSSINSYLPWGNRFMTWMGLKPGTQESTGGLRTHSRQNMR